MCTHQHILPVLVTAIEFLREEEQEENQVSEREGTKQAEPTIANLEGSNQFEVEDEAKPKEAWTVAPMKLSRTSILPVLAAFGMLLLLRYYKTTVALKDFLFREEGDAHHCALCFLHLLWNCCNFLLLNLNCLNC